MRRVAFASWSDVLFAGWIVLIGVLYVAQFHPFLKAGLAVLYRVLFSP